MLSVMNLPDIVKEIVDRNGNKVDWSIKDAYRRLKSGQAVIDELNEKIRSEGWVVSTTKAQNGHGSYGLYEDLQQTNDPRQTANNFMDWCIGNGTLPLFYQFASHENYYKLLYDFNVYDCVTEEYAPQQAVTNTYPTMVDGQVQPGNVTDGGFNTEYFQGTIEKQMAFMDEYSRNRDEDLEKLAENMEEGNYTLHSDRFVEDKYFARQIDKLSDLKEGSYVTVGKIITGSPIEKVGIPAGNLYFDVSKIRQEMVDRKDPIPPETIKGIPKVLDNPILITEFVDKAGRHSINVYGKLYIGSSPVVIGIMIGKHRNGQAVDKIQTVHPNRHFLDEVTDSNTLYLGENKKETNAWFQALGAQEPPLGGTKYGFIRMLSQSDGSVKRSDRDSTYLDAVMRGDMETAQRMVDEAARLAGYIPVTRYHQTASRFTQFSTDHPVAGRLDTETPNGIFFKTNDHDIGLGGAIQMALYLKADNMLHFADRKEANAWYRKNVPGYDALQQELDKALKPFLERLNDIEEQEFDTSRSDEEVNALFEEEERVIEEMREVEDSYRAELRKLLDQYFLHGESGYDGIELDYDGHRWVNGKREDVHTYIVFKPSQAKSSDPVTYDDSGNIIPLSERFNTEKDDIRYQDRTEDSVSNRSLLANALEGVAKTDLMCIPHQRFPQLVIIDSPPKLLAFCCTFACTIMPVFGTLLAQKKKFFVYLLSMFCDQKKPVFCTTFDTLLIRHHFPKNPCAATVFSIRTSEKHHAINVICHSYGFPSISVAVPQQQRGSTRSDGIGQHPGNPHRHYADRP